MKGLLSCFKCCILEVHGVPTFREQLECGFSRIRSDLDSGDAGSCPHSSVSNHCATPYDLTSAIEMSSTEIVYISETTVILDVLGELRKARSALDGS